MNETSAQNSPRVTGELQSLTDVFLFSQLYQPCYCVFHWDELLLCCCLVQLVKNSRPARLILNELPLVLGTVATEQWDQLWTLLDENVQRVHHVTP